MLRHSSLGTSGWIAVSEVRDDHVNLSVNTVSTFASITMSVDDVSQLVVNLRATLNEALAKTVTEGKPPTPNSRQGGLVDDGEVGR